MHFSNSLAVAALAVSSTQAFSFSLSRRQNATQGCPAVWTTIAGQLTDMFVSGGQCTDDARAAIRGVFHDCFPQGGCDGSLALPEELARSDNSPMTSTINKLSALAAQNNVGVADMLMFAGSHAVASCPGGPVVQTYIGRTDATVPAPDGQLPQANVSGDDALSHFQARGFSAQDLGALIGAHTASRQFNTDAADAGASQDSTPGIWDLIYFIQTLTKSAPFTFQSDINLSNQDSVGPFMKQFSTDKGSWDSAYTAAMAKMELLDNAGPSSMVDCTSALPQSQSKRSAKTHFARQIINSLGMSKK